MSARVSTLFNENNNFRYIAKMYDENSDTSDVNADEIDKILENMEDLDNALLRGTLKRKDSKKESTIPVTESKKKVIFKGI